MKPYLPSSRAFLGYALEKKKQTFAFILFLNYPSFFLLKNKGQTNTKKQRKKKSFYIITYFISRF